MVCDLGVRRSGLVSCSLVLVDHAAEDLSSNRFVDGDEYAWVVVGWVLVEALVWTVVVEVAFVLADHGPSRPPRRPGRQASFGQPGSIQRLTATNW
ncbi:hypothetical protein AB0J72_45035 [Dactylosporangium sp. NPDC049742]|uniref:hypothetical protein n=1 Tax=Dactylosporangium sp. NPDC049742 TaxID=3154737 RepID=UPI003433FF8F